ncbi:hypothetical protein MMC12_008620, partial [Toensbergia leucococca]|nr:hypothetical protein [Toensbergia leucococca]
MAESDVAQDIPTSPTSLTSPDTLSKHSPPPSSWQRIYSIISYTPQRCRYDPAQPPRFSMPLNLLFGFAGAFTVANLYYNHPILNILADDFGVSHEK